MGINNIQRTKNRDNHYNQKLTLIKKKWIHLQSKLAREKGGEKLPKSGMKGMRSKEYTDIKIITKKYYEQL